MGNIWHKAQCFPLRDIPDCTVWKLEKKLKFSVKSLYNALSVNDCGKDFKQIWKGKVPPKIRIFMWLLENNAVLTKDNMIKRNWEDNPGCFFCDSNETMITYHLFFNCPIAEVIWACIARYPGANNITRDLTQCWNWLVQMAAPLQEIPCVRVAAIC